MEKDYLTYDWCRRRRSWARRGSAPSPLGDGEETLQNPNRRRRGDAKYGAIAPWHLKKERGLLFDGVRASARPVAYGGSDRRRESDLTEYPIWGHAGSDSLVHYIYI
ncbi:hypothetical protein BHE74_00046029 [Ensete ventricosum]|uniref:Uncharacterized protein n=1 Tax=Ensete ventricosum TaxID=4639 RepID=A0A444G040_ENSVE|nr:hypothetical protein B296_00004961 [Ensete ventricosum]RWW28231.1 hypothetical protein GW17_00007305 [Ensete ventricosum]RWW47948.1 hypothetical protein BHE74_00046029 [Ensete ventricosum]